MLKDTSVRLAECGFLPGRRVGRKSLIRTIVCLGKRGWGVKVLKRWRKIVVTRKSQSSRCLCAKVVLSVDVFHRQGPPRRRTSFMPENRSKLRVQNLTRNTLIGDFVDKAKTSAERRTGLLKKPRLGNGGGLWIVPCEGVHTFFMKFTIDLIYLDKARKVKKTVRALRPWRLSLCLTAHSILEVPQGTIDRTNTRKGDQLDIQTSLPV